MSSLFGVDDEHALSVDLRALTLSQKKFLQRALENDGYSNRFSVDKLNGAGGVYEMRRIGTVGSRFLRFNPERKDETRVVDIGSIFILKAYREVTYEEALELIVTYRCMENLPEKDLIPQL